MMTWDQKVKTIVKCLKEMSYDNYLSEHLGKPTRRNIAIILKLEAEDILNKIGIKEESKP